MDSDFFPPDSAGPDSTLRHFFQSRKSYVWFEWFLNLRIGQIRVKKIRIICQIKELCPDFVTNDSCILSHVILSCCTVCSKTWAHLVKFIIWFICLRISDWVFRQKLTFGSIILGSEVWNSQTEFLGFCRLKTSMTVFYLGADSTVCCRGRGRCRLQRWDPGLAIGDVSAVGVQCVLNTGEQLVGVKPIADSLGGHR